MPQPPLPVPRLEATLERIMHSVTAVCPPLEQEQARADAARFLSGPGPALQSALERFADEETVAGRNWLTELWQHAYLDVREPLSLTTNVAFQLALPAPAPEAVAAPETASEPAPEAEEGTCAAPASHVLHTARVLRSIAAVHLTQARGDTAPVVDARGSELCMRQWAAFNGGVRHPAPGRDRFLPCTLDGRLREIGVLRDGRMFAVTVSDENGRPLSEEALVSQLQQVLAHARTESRPSGELAQSDGPLPRTDELPHPGDLPRAEALRAAEPGFAEAGFTEPGFTEASHLGSDTLAAILDEMLTDGSNAAAYDRLRDFLFTGALTGENCGHCENSGASEDHEAGDDCNLGDDRSPGDVRDLGSTGGTGGSDGPSSRGSGHAPADQASASATADRTTTADDTATASAPTTADETAADETAADETAADETAAADALRSALTDRRAAWVRKPLSYLMDLHAGTVIVNVEHTVVDGGSLVDAVTRMQEHAAAQVPKASTPASPGTPPPNLQASPNAATDPDAATAPDLPANPDARAVAEVPARSDAPAELRWNLTAELQAALTAALTGLGRRAEDLRVAVVRVPRPAADEQARPYSSDALQQLIMASAQVLTYGRVRGVYESVDMRAFQDGRTECLRPVTPEAVTFAHRLCDSQARLEDLEAALDAHRAWVKACKSGNGFDRHLAGLRMMAARQGVTDPFLTSPALARVRTDFLSTTSLGTPAQVVRYAFAPTVENGFGIAYTQRAQDYEFCVSWHAGSAEAPDAFLTNIPRAAALLRDFLRTLCTDG
jgi:hypothetical protein